MILVFLYYVNNNAVNPSLLELSYCAVDLGVRITQTIIRWLAGAAIRMIRSGVGACRRKAKRVCIVVHGVGSSASC